MLSAGNFLPGHDENFRAMRRQRTRRLTCRNLWSFLLADSFDCLSLAFRMDARRTRDFLRNEGIASRQSKGASMSLKKLTNEVSSTIYSLPWYVARDEGYLKDEGLDVEFIPAKQGTPKNASEDTRLVNPIVGHAPFEDGQVNLFRACEEGNVRRAFDLSNKTVKGCDVRITSLQPSRPVHAI